MRRFTYRNKIKVSADDLIAAQAGRKTCTIRLGIVDVEGTELYLTDGQGRTRIRITEVENTKTLEQLTEREVMGEGFRTKEELEADLRRYYRNLASHEPVTVIWFEVISPQLGINRGT